MHGKQRVLKQWEAKQFFTSLLTIIFKKIFSLTTLSVWRANSNISRKCDVTD